MSLCLILGWYTTHKNVIPKVDQGIYPIRWLPPPSGVCGYFFYRYKTGSLGCNLTICVLGFKVPGFQHGHVENDDWGLRAWKGERERQGERGVGAAKEISISDFSNNRQHKYLPTRITCCHESNTTPDVLWWNMFDQLAWASVRLLSL